MLMGFEGEPLVQSNNSGILARERLYRLLETAMHYPLVVLCAGSGYGKTQAVYSFLRGYDARTTWIQLTERDNVTSHFWEKYTNMVSKIWPEVGARLRDIGFPDTDELYLRYSQQRRRAHSSPKEKYIMVYDDFHVLRNQSVLRFFERMAKELPLNGTVILLTRVMPKFNIVGLMMNESVFTIREDTMRFTEEETTEYYKQLGLPLSQWNIREIMDDTEGWPFAVNLIGQSVKNTKRYERRTLEAMKKNIFRMIEDETSRTVSEALLRFLLRISLIDHLSAELIRVLAADDCLIGQMEELTAYIRYDHHLDAYVIHHLFLEYLKQNQDSLTQEQKVDTYRKAGVWCEENDYPSDALSYYEKSGDWDAIIRIVSFLKFQTAPDLAAYTLELLDRMPEDAFARNPLAPAMRVKMLVSLGKIEDAEALARRYSIEYEKLPDSPSRNRALAELYGAWGLLRVIRCPDTDVYDFDYYFEKQKMYYDLNPFEVMGPAASISVGVYAILVGTPRAGAPEEYIEALAKTIPHLYHSLGGCMYGLDDLARGELHFIRREFTASERYFKLAQDKARLKKQYTVQHRALLYSMLNALVGGDIESGNRILGELEAMLDLKDFPIRFEAYDIAQAQYHVALGQPESIPEWLKTDLTASMHPAFFTNYANRMKLHYHYLTGQYGKLLAFFQSARKKRGLLFGDVTYRVIEALSLFQLKRRKEAVSVLAEAYELAAPNRLVVPFTEFAKDMRTLTAAALKDDACTIPRKWLEDINLKASAFSKRQSNLKSEYQLSRQPSGSISLTAREKEILSSLSQGISRSEIAQTHNISPNSVKMSINMINEKLFAKNLVEAIRVAKERGII